MLVLGDCRGSILRGRGYDVRWRGLGVGVGVVGNLLASELSRHAMVLHVWDGCEVMFSKSELILQEIRGGLGWLVAGGGVVMGMGIGLKERTR